MLGVLGGMGPLATVDFLNKLIKETGNVTDQRHIPTITWSVPQIPDRSNHIVNGAENPFPALRRGALQLQTLGASVIAIPCNTAHFWYEELINNTDVTILHIVDAVIEQLQHLNSGSTLAPDTAKRTIGLLGTTGTIKANVYQHKLTAANWHVITPCASNQHKLMKGIALAKHGDIHAARMIFLSQVEKLKQQGAQAIILGCTEIPAVLEHTDELIDSNQALARRCVQWFDATYNGIQRDANIHTPKQ